MENIYGLLNTFGVVPAEWYTMLNETQKLVFVTLTGVTVALATLSVILLASRWRGKQMPPPSSEETEISKAAADAVHEILFNALVANKITPKFYKRKCREWSVVLSDLYGSPYTKKAQVVMRAMRKRMGIVRRIELLREGPSKNFLEYCRKVSVLLNNVQEQKASKSKFMSQ